MRSYRIAICDDDAPVGQDLAMRCEAIFAAWHVDVAVSLFPSADALGALLKAGASDFDLFLLDIEMHGTDGLALAQWLYDNGERDKVIFITGHVEYALAGYQAHPLHYLLKPVDDHALEEALHLAWSLHGPQRLVLKKGRRTFSVLLSNIRYLESQGHHTTIHFSDETRLFNFSLSELERQLPGKNFVRSHKSYLVNLAWVDEIVRSSVRLRDGEEVPIIRNFYLGFQSAFVSYLNHSSI